MALDDLVNRGKDRCVRGGNRRPLLLAMVAELEPDLIRLRTHRGMKVGRHRASFAGRPWLNPMQEVHLVSLVCSGEYSTLEVARRFGVGRSTVYRAIERPTG